VAVPERLGPQQGIVEANRLLGNDGTVETRGQSLRLSPVLAGPPTRGAGDRRETVPFRLRLRVTGKVSTGTVHYEQRKGQDIVVATFEHALDAAGEGGPALQCYRDVRLGDFDAEPPQNAALDEGQLAAQQSRVLKRRSLLERRRFAPTVPARRQPFSDAQYRFLHGSGGTWRAVRAGGGLLRARRAHWFQAAA